MEPVVDLMLRVQSLGVPIWKLKLWWPIVKAKLQKAANGDTNSFPRLQKAGETIRPGGQYKSVELLEGWLVTNDGGEETPRAGRFTWKMRESVVVDGCLPILQVFDAALLVALHCGCREDDVLKLNVADGEYEIYGVEECKALMSVALKMPHTSTSGMDFDPRLAFRYMKRIKDAVKAGIWDGRCPDWFRLINNNTPLLSQDTQLVSFEAVESETLDTLFKMKFQSGKEYGVRLQEQSFHSSFYSNEDVYSVAKPPSCVLLDIALSKGGPEAIAESFYNSMRAQQQSGGQSNETLARRTKLNWCLPSLKKCDSIIKESVRLYFEGDDVIRGHRGNTLFSGRAQNYSVSKVVDRVDSELGRCPFLADS